MSVALAYRPLGDLLLRPPRYGINAAAVPLSSTTLPYIRITDIDDLGRYAPDPKVGVSHPNASAYQLRAGELVFARTGATVGKSYLYDPRDGDLVYAGFLINIAPDPQLLNPKYLSLFAETKEYWDWIARTSVRSGQPGVNGQEYASLPIRVPSVTVQNAIAEMMRDVDSLVESIECAIVKTRAIKQGMMQSLLDGSIRLPGHVGDWSTNQSIDDVCDTRTGFWGRGRPDESANVQVMVVRAGDILSSGDLKDSARRYFTEVEQQKAGCRAGDTLITTSGTGLGKTHFVRATDKVAASNFVRLLRPKSGIHGEFVYYLLRSDRATQLLHVHTATSAYPNLLQSFFTQAWIDLPSYDEQRAIAAALRCVDDELQTLRLHLKHTVEIRIGMIQQLLGGRTGVSSLGVSA